MRRILLVMSVAALAVLSLAVSPALAQDYTAEDFAYWDAFYQAAGCAYGVEAYCNPDGGAVGSPDYASALDAWIAGGGCDPYAFMATPECYSSYLEFEQGYLGY